MPPVPTFEMIDAQHRADGNIRAPMNVFGCGVKGVE
jgi:hypothetical protein